MAKFAKLDQATQELVISLHDHRTLFRDELGSQTQQISDWHTETTELVNDRSNKIEKSITANTEAMSSGFAQIQAQVQGLKAAIQQGSAANDAELAQQNTINSQRRIMLEAENKKLKVSVVTVP
jgi:gas vesicle protein